MIPPSNHEFVNFTLTVVTSIIAFLVAVKKVRELDKEPAALPLSIAMGLLSIWRMDDFILYLRSIGIFSVPLAIWDFISMVSYFYGAAFLFFYINYNISNEQKIIVRPWLHLTTPTLLTLSYSISILYFTISHKSLASIEEIHDRLGTGLYIFYTIGLLSKILSIQIKYNRFEMPIFILNIITIFLILGAIFSFLFGQNLLVSVFLLTVLSLLFIFGDIYSSSMQIVHDIVIREKYINSHIKDLNVKEILIKIDQLLSEEKIYRDDQISLKSFANKLGLSSHQTSELINRNMGTSYSNLIANFRVAEAKELLKKDPQASIITVAYHVGYNSLSSFYSAFKKFTGLSPGSYQKLINHE